MKFDFIANIKDGLITQRFQESIDRYLLTIKDGPARITIEKYRPKRTDPQNRYYWSVVVGTVAQHCGYTDDEAHEALKWLFLRKRSEDGKPATVRSTAKLNTQEFEEYLESIKRWAATDLQIYIPDPNEEAK